MGYTSDPRLAAYLATVRDVNNGYAGLNGVGQIYSYRLPMACGVVSITPVSGTPTAGTVTFPTGRFTTAANIAVTTSAATSAGTIIATTVTAVSTTGCTVWLNRNSTALTFVYWIAMEETWLGS